MNKTFRWTIKKISRGGVAISSWVFGQLDKNGESEDAEHVRVLTYHRFGTRVHDPFCILPEVFQTHISHLVEHSNIISLTEFDSYIKDGRPLPKRSIMITIDDGFLSTFTEALPILRDLGVPAVAFVTPSLIGKSSVCENLPEDYMNWNHLEILADNHIDIGSHSLTHRSLGSLSLNQVTEEMVRSREVLETRLGKRVTAFAYPYGTRADFNPATTMLLEIAGYRYGFTSQHGSIRYGHNAYCLPRIKIESGEELWLFKMLVRGGLDHWSWVDKALWRFQASHRH